jgi:hypothetical protein
VGALAGLFTGQHRLEDRQVEAQRLARSGRGGDDDILTAAGALERFGLVRVQSAGAHARHGLGEIRAQPRRGALGAARWQNARRRQRIAKVRILL